ncbi:hypothetical protein Tco_1190293 [Tanacetum coccineum]
MHTVAGDGVASIKRCRCDLSTDGVRNLATVSGRDENPIRTLGDYSKPSQEGYKNTIELPVGNDVVPLRSDTIWTYSKKSLIMASIFGSKSKFFMTMSIPSQDEPLTNRPVNDPRDFAKPVKAIALPKDVPSTSGRCLIVLENRVQRLMEAHLAPMQPTQVNKVTTSCEICSGPHDTQYCMENLEKPLLIMRPRVPTKQDGSGILSSLSKTILVTPTIRHGEVLQTLGLVSNFMASQDARLSKFEVNFKQQQSKMTNKINTVLKAITNRIAGALPSDMVKNLKLNTSPVLSSCSYPTKDPQCLTQIHSSINAITICPKQPNEPQNDKSKEEKRERKGNPKDNNTMTHIKEQIDTPQVELKDTTVADNLWPNKNDEGIEWLDVEEPLDLIDTSEELVYESLIQEMPKCSLNYDFRIKKGDPGNLKIPCRIDRGRNFVGLGRDMHVFVGNMSYVIDFTILENIETNIDPSLSHVIFRRPFIEIACLAINRKYNLMTFTYGIKEVTFKTPYKDQERRELSSEGHDLLSSRVILSEDDYDRGCRKSSNLEDGFYKNTIKLGSEYLTGMDDEGEVT